MDKVSQLLTHKATLVAQASALNDEGLHVRDNRSKYDLLITEITATQQHLDMLGKIDRSLPGGLASINAQPASAQPQIPNTSDGATQRRGKLNTAWRTYLKTGQAAEHRDLIVQSDASGGALLPQEFSGFLTTALKFFAPLAQYAQVRRGNVAAGLKFPKVDDTANGLTYIAEDGSTVLSEADAAFSSDVVNGDIVTTGQIRYSNQLRDDSDFDLESLLTDLSSTRFGRGLEVILTRGTDSSGVTMPNNPGLINFAPTGTTTAALTNGIGWNDLIALFDSVDTAYLPRAVWQMNSKTRNALLKLQDSTSRPYFVPAPSADGLDMLLGKPIVVNQSLDQLNTASGVPVLFGDLYSGLGLALSPIIVTPTVERYAEYNESSLATSARVGSTQLIAGAVKALKLAAS